jgi:UDP-N-acetylglucosamine 3-dehydrogenase
MAKQKKTKQYRVGVIGAGAIAQACHLPGYAKNGAAELAAFADPERARHTETLKIYPGLRGYTRYQDMLRGEQLDVVSICTPNKFHAPAAIAALEAGCHVLCEKPMAMNLREADRMIAAAKAARRKLMIGFTHRCFTGTQTCKEMLAKGAIGKPFMIRVRFAHGGPYPGWAKGDWFYDKKLALGGAMFDMGIHAIDLCLWLFGPVRAVSGRAATLIKKIEVDDNALMLLDFKNGALGYIEVGWTSKPGFSGLEIYGTEGSLICDYINGLKLCGGKASAGRDSSTTWKTIDSTPITGGWDTEIDTWMDVVQGNEKLTMDGMAGRNALEVALAAYRSDRTGRRIALG